jgi:hypothetical protein
VAGGHTFAQVASGPTHVCAVTTSGELWCWGNTLYGQLGHPVRVDPTTGESKPGEGQPVRVEGLPPMKQVAVALGTTCALSTEGALWCWGRRTELTTAGGGLFPPSSADSDGVVAPFRLGGPRAYSRVVLGQSTGCLLLDDGSVECWGTLSGLSGPPCGGNSMYPCAAPVPVDFGVPLVDLAVADFTVCGIAKETGDEYCLAQGRPPALTKNGPFVALAMGGFSTCFTSKDGVVSCEALGQTSGSETWPRLHGVSSNADARCGIDGAGDVWCWGTNSGGIFGDGSIDSSDPPVRTSNPFRY